MAPKAKRVAATGKAEVKHDPVPPPLPLLPVPDDAALPGDELCPACAALQLMARRFIVFSGDPEYQQWSGQNTTPAVLQAVADARRNTHCPLCRLLLVSLAGSAGRVPDVDRHGRNTQIAVGWGTTGRVPNRDEPWGMLSDVRMLCPSLVVEGGSFPTSTSPLWPSFLKLHSSPTTRRRTPRPPRSPSSPGPLVALLSTST
jgi:hypothetical protein